MKKLLTIILTASLLIGVTACRQSIPDDRQETESEATTTTEATTTEATTTETAAVTETTTETTATPSAITENTLLLLEPLGGYEQDSERYFDTSDWTQLFELSYFREYFFGTWEGAFRTWEEDNWINREITFVIDDAEKRSSFLAFNTAGYYKSGDIIIYIGNHPVGAYIYWIDTNDPDTMYYIGVDRKGDNQYKTAKLYDDRFETIAIFTKTNDPINQPEEDNFMSRYKLEELAFPLSPDGPRYYLFNDVHYNGAWRNDVYNYFPIYLISQSTDKFVLKTTLSTEDLHELTTDEIIYLDVIYTIEKIDGEWVRTVEEV
ncbi:MAG: hypothetical protein FWD34_04895 [Oscillospiraceae bacterium]|nr:hypothetical protein [Oscillospiraceae bacterium]